jgi:acyl transferase domain-containing protein
MERIAVIGLGCRFPGADDVLSFWRLLDEGTDAITEVPADRWDVAAFYDPNPAKPGKISTRWGGFLTSVDEFDPSFFGISRREAASMDPQQRLLLEVAWEALETAGYSPVGLGGSRTGVFVGISGSDYWRLQNRIDLLDVFAATGSALSIAANRLSYLLDLRGPSMAVDTACSSSLVAVHLGCESLRHRESDLVIAGGVNVILSPELSVAFSRARMLAADGRCKTFDARADGYVRGEGCGVVILKRFADAVRDADHIVAIIRGSAVSQDGMSNGLTAPNGLAQQAVIREALRRADVLPGRVGYVEAHGTGTPLGDPIELQALATALGEGRREDDTLAVGSVKTNIGHLEAAAGIAGLIKAILVLDNEKIPAHLHLKERNPRLPAEAPWLVIPGHGLPWPRGRRRRFAGTSSFGFGGTNAHVVLEEAPAVRSRQSSGNEIDRPLHLLALSARTAESLRELARRFAERQPLAGRSESLADICYTTNVSRSAHRYRLATIAGSSAELVSSLRLFADGKASAASPDGRAGHPAQPKIAFLFTGQGSQYAGIGRLLDQTQPTFRRALDGCEKVLNSCLERPLRSVLYGDAGSQLDQTIYTHAALFSVEYALAAMWRSWGIVPDIVAGYSLGEYAAACIAGIFSLEEGLDLIVAHGRSMQALPQDGVMAAVHTGVARVAEILEAEAGGVDIAAVNGPRHVVVSGRSKAVRAVMAALEDEGVVCQVLKASHAFHSPLMEPILGDLEAACSGVRFRRPEVDMVSTFTGQMLDPAEIPDASHWRRQTRGTVRFATAVESLIAAGATAFVEIGPHPALLDLVSEIPGSSGILRLPTLTHGRDDWRIALGSLAALYTHGVPVDWAGFDQDYRRRRVCLPTYPFQREKCWVGVTGRLSLRR